MELSLHIDALRDDLNRLAAVGGDEVAEAARRLSDALDSSIRLRLVDVLSEAALEVNDKIDSGHIEVRLAGRDPELVFVAEASAGATATVPTEDGLSARITLRLPEGLKAQIEGAAAREGVSVNTWLVRVLARAVDIGFGGRGRRERPGRRMTGFAQD